MSDFEDGPELFRFIENLIAQLITCADTKESYQYIEMLELW